MSIKKSNIIMVLYMVFLVIALLGCQSVSMVEYYSQKDNYVDASGTVSHLYDDVENRTLYIGFADLTPSFDDTNFKIAGNNYDIIMGNGIMEEMKVGVNVKFVSAPLYFGDGYVMPIASITIGHKPFLDFETGFANILTLYTS